MWRPVSKVEYQSLHDKGQILVVACPMAKRDVELRAKWASRACAIAPDSSLYLRDVVRDLLANPQVRAIVFEGPACGRAAYEAFWQGVADPAWNIKADDLALVRQFVDLFDDDCSWKEPPQPFWPARIMYLDDKEK